MPVTINGTTGVIGPDGSASTPSYQGADSNTGMFFPAADTIAFAEGGVEVARFNADAQFVAAAGTASLPVITTTGDVNTGIFFPAADTIAFAEGGVESTRIDSNGNMVFASRSGAGNTAQIQVGLTSALGTGMNAYGQFAADSTSPYPLGVKGNSSSQGIVGFFDSANSVVGSISKSGSSVAYNTSSDYRLKEDVQPMTGALSRVAALKPVTYKWKSDGFPGEGFIAHELAEVCPSAVTGAKDALNEDGSIKPQGIDTSFLVATLTAAIQELTARVQALEAKA